MPHNLIEGGGKRPVFELSIEDRGGYMCKHIKIHLKEVFAMFMKNFTIVLFEINKNGGFITIEDKIIHFNEVDDIVIKLIIERGMSGLGDHPFFVKVDYDNLKFLESIDFCKKHKENSMAVKNFELYLGEIKSGVNYINMPIEEGFFDWEGKTIYLKDLSVGIIQTIFDRGISEFLTDVECPFEFDINDYDISEVNNL